MNNLQSITASLELSKELAAHGYPQGTTIFSYLKSSKDEWVIGRWDGSLAIAAPTAQELLDHIPFELNFGEHNMDLKVHPLIGHARHYFVVVMQSRCASDMFIKVEDGNLCNALAKLYIKLKQQDLL